MTVTKQEFILATAKLSRGRATRSAKLAEAVSVSIDRARRRARTRMSTLAAATDPPKLTAAIAADRAARPVPAWSPGDLELDGLDEEISEEVGPILRDAALALFLLLAGRSVLTQVAQDRLDKQIGNLGRIGDGIADRVGNALTEARTSGLSIGDTVELIDSLLQHEAEVKAAEVARDQATALEGGMAQSTIDADALDVYKTWLSMRDGAVRDAHDDADGQTVDAADPFDVDGEPLLYPKDPDGSPGNTINCRCLVGWSETLEQAENEDFSSITDPGEGA